MLKILCVGPQWRGSNAGGLFRAFSRIGHLINVVDENYYINLSNYYYKTKAIDKIFRSWHIQDFNRAILTQAQLFQPDIVLVYKGAFVLPRTIRSLIDSFVVVNFYPDVSFRAHGSLLAKTLPLYQHVFTTKTFAIKDMKEQLGVNSASFIPHGFDPDLHRIINISQTDTSYYDCDVSFIGGYSLKKEHLLASLIKVIPGVKLKIWGGRWENAQSPELHPSIMGRSITGDLYILAILSSKINLGLLHERVKGASSGDLITSRTFHIPAAGGFMLHERTKESVLYFEEGKEAAFFENAEELCEKVKYYLQNTKERELISKQGHTRAWKDHSLDKRAVVVVKYLLKLCTIAKNQ